MQTHSVIVDVSNESEIGGLLLKLCPPELELVFRNKTRSAQPSVAALLSFGRPVREDLMLVAPNLRFVQLMSAGTDGVDFEFVERAGLRVADNNGINSNAVADHTLMLMLSLLRQGVAGDRNVHHGHWQEPPMNIENLHELGSKIVGVIGLGRIGSKVASRVIAFGAQVQYCDILDIDTSQFDGVKKVSLDELCATSDIVTLHVPHTVSTNKLIDAEMLGLMSRESWLINTSRGPVVDLDALIVALQQNAISGAGLDVFPNEPNVDPRLLELGNVILSPHRAGSSIENWNERIAFAFRNIAEFLEMANAEALLD